MGSIKEKNRKIKSCDILPLTIFLNEGRVQSHKGRVFPTKNNFSQWRGQVTEQQKRGELKKRGQHKENWELYSKELQLTKWAVHSIGRVEDKFTTKGELSQWAKLAKQKASFLDSGEFCDIFLSRMGKIDRQNQRGTSRLCIQLVIKECHTVDSISNGSKSCRNFQFCH